MRGIGYHDWFALVKEEVGYYRKENTPSVDDLMFNSLSILEDAYDQGVCVNIAARLLTAHQETEFHKEKL